MEKNGIIPLSSLTSNSQSKKKYIKDKGMFYKVMVDRCGPMKQ